MASQFWMTSKFFFIALLCTLISCGQADDTTQSSSFSTKNAQKPLFITMGGNTSCTTDQDNRENSPTPTDMYLNAKAFIWDSSLLGNDWNFIASCHTDAATVYFVDSRSPDDIQAMEQAEFTNHVMALSDESSSVFMAGHSYGGWLAMKLAAAFKNEGNLGDKTFGLYTVDPISRRHCRFSTPFGCRRAPQDFTTEEKSAIGLMANDWLNFYQTSTWYLHSSSIEEADGNTEVNTSHTGMDASQSVWTAIQENVRTNIGGSSLELVNN